MRRGGIAISRMARKHANDATHAANICRVGPIVVDREMLAGRVLCFSIWSRNIDRSGFVDWSTPSWRWLKSSGVATEVLKSRRVSLAGSSPHVGARLAIPAARAGAQPALRARRLARTPTCRRHKERSVCVKTRCALTHAGPPGSSNLRPLVSCRPVRPALSRHLLPASTAPDADDFHTRQTRLAGPDHHGCL